MEIGFAICCYVVYETFKWIRRDIKLEGMGTADFFWIGLMKLCMLCLEALALFMFIAISTSWAW